MQNSPEKLARFNVVIDDEHPEALQGIGREWADGGYLTSRQRPEELNRLGWKAEDEDRPRAVPAIVRLHFPAVQLDELPDERESHAHAAGHTRQGRIGLAETIKNPRKKNSSAQN